MRFMRDGTQAVPYNEMAPFIFSRVVLPCPEYVTEGRSSSTNVIFSHPRGCDAY